MWKYIFYGLLSVVLARFKSFENYKVYRVVPATDTYLQVLRELQEAPWKNEVTQFFRNKILCSKTQSVKLN